VSAGKHLGPFHGVPICVKESFGVKGEPDTWGIVALKDSKAPANSTAVQRLLDSGAVLLGGTNVPLNLMDWQSFNDIYGTTNNPWDLTRTPGGSSGGSAAALAAGLGLFEPGQRYWWLAACSGILLRHILSQAHSRPGQPERPPTRRRRWSARILHRIGRGRSHGAQRGRSDGGSQNLGRSRGIRA